MKELRWVGLLAHMGDTRNAVRRIALLVTSGINMREHMIYGCDKNLSGSG
jgi:hypothetical protein